MKIRLLLALVLMTVSVFGQNVPSYVPTNGLVGWWPFNGNANDESGNGNNGTPMNGVALTTDRFGSANSAYSFDGIDDYILVPDNSTLDLTSSFTISTWFNSSSFGVVNMIISKHDVSLGSSAGTYALGLWQVVNQLVNFQATPNFNSSTYPGANGQVNTNTWRNFVVSYDTSVNTLAYYLDGNLIFSTNIIFTIQNNSQPFRIGANYNNPNIMDLFNGAIDDIGVWNRALTQQEITNLYNASTSIPIIGCPGAQLPVNVLNGLVGWWPFCGDADDESGNGNNGTVNGATLTSDRFGNVNSAYSFDGTSQFISSQYFPPFGKSSRSVNVWAKTNSTNHMVMVNWGSYANSSATGEMFELSLGTFPSTCNGLIMDVTNGVRAFPFNSDDNNWHMYTVVVDSVLSDQIQSFNYYIDGNIVSSSCNNGNQIINTGQLEPFTIGKFVNQSIRYFNGKLDDIGIWNRALDSSEVAQLYNTGLCTQTIAGSCDTLIFNANITGFNPVTYANQVKVYPNPASDNLVIDCGTNYTGLNGYSIRITNLLGQTVYNSPVTVQITNIQLNPPTWVNGTYVVQFVHPNGTVMDTKRIIIQ